MCHRFEIKSIIIIIIIIDLIFSHDNYPSVSAQYIHGNQVWNFLKNTKIHSSR